MSRSVKIPVSRSSSITSAAPTWLVPITVAASATLAWGDTTTRAVLMTSRIATMTPPSIKPSRAGDARKALRDWYRPRGRAYPWRRGPLDPYRVLVCEVMAQQTQAPRVAAAYGPFLERFPTVESLARASRPDVLRAWAGLGY